MENLVTEGSVEPATETAGVWASSVRPAILATLFTWFVTAAGAALVFVLPENDSKGVKTMMDSLLGFAGGVMVAASYFSLLAPAVEAAKASSLWKAYPAFPVVLGFCLGGYGMVLTDDCLKYMGLDGDGEMDLIQGVAMKKLKDGEGPSTDFVYGAASGSGATLRDSIVRRRGKDGG